MDNCTYLTGRLRLSPDTGRPEIDRLGSGSGAELLEACCNPHLDEVAPLARYEGALRRRFTA